MVTGSEEQVGSQGLALSEGRSIEFRFWYKRHPYPLPFYIFIPTDVQGEINIRREIKSFI